MGALDGASLTGMQVDDVICFEAPSEFNYAHGLLLLGCANEADGIMHGFDHRINVTVRTTEHHRSDQLHQYAAQLAAKQVQVHDRGAMLTGVGFKGGVATYVAIQTAAGHQSKYRRVGFTAQRNSVKGLDCAGSFCTLPPRRRRSSASTARCSSWRSIPRRGNWRSCKSWPGPGRTTRAGPSTRPPWAQRTAATSADRATPTTTSRSAATLGRPGAIQRGFRQAAGSGAWQAALDHYQGTPCRAGPRRSPTRQSPFTAASGPSRAQACTRVVARRAASQAPHKAHALSSPAPVRFRDAFGAGGNRAAAAPPSAVARARQWLAYGGLSTGSLSRRRHHRRLGGVAWRTRRQRSGARGSSRQPSGSRARRMRAHASATICTAARHSRRRGRPVGSVGSSRPGQHHHPPTAQLAVGAQGAPSGMGPDLNGPCRQRPVAVVSRLAANQPPAAEQVRALPLLRAAAFTAGKAPPGPATG